MPEPDPEQLERILADCGCRGRLSHTEPVAGGDINAAWHVATDRNEQLFIKLNRAERSEMLAAESEGLAAIAGTGCIRVPEPRGTGVTGGTAWLACEFLNLGPVTSDSETRLGEALACLHAVTADRFGWHRDNTIGLTPQSNTPTGDWCTFLRDHRLGHQLRLAAENGHGGRLQALGERLLNRLPELLADHDPPAALIHGDLWSGNRAALADGTPVIFDPACHYADPESDIAMTELFGAFGPGFYAAYQRHHPLDAGYHTVRRPLYQLYHVLNHLNLFGVAFRGHAESLMDRLLSTQ